MLMLLVSFLAAFVAGEPVDLGDLPMQNPDLFEGDIIGVDDLNDRNAIADPNLKWPGGKVPYVIDESLSQDKDIIEKAMQDYHSKTCIRFIERKNETDYVIIISRFGCYSHVGRIGGAQPLSLRKGGCLHHGTIVHELGHAIGFYHEHNRSDRDDHLIIYWGNILDGMGSQFRKLKNSENILYNSFDINSIMLYGETTFSKNCCDKTMVAKNGQKLRNVQDKPGLSEADVERVNRLYNC